MHDRHRRAVRRITLSAGTDSQGVGRASPPRPCEPSVALLIDGENCSPDVAAAALAKAGEFGRVAVRRVYANWALPSNRGWIEPVARYDIRPIHHEPTATGKNATDILLAIGAMDLLHSGKIDCFCLVASDSDYTPLVARLRAAERTVVVIGRAKTPPSLIQASSVFVSLEGLAAVPRPQPSTSEPPTREAGTTMPALAPAPTAMAEMSPASARQPSPSSGLASAPAPQPLPALASSGEAIAGTKARPVSSPSSAPASPSPGPRATPSPSTPPLPALARGASPAQAPPVAASGRGDVTGIGGAPSAKTLTTAPPPDPGPLLTEVWERVRREHGAVFVSTFIAEFERLHPDFQPRLYGCGWVAQLLKQREDLFTLRRDASEPGQISVLRVSDQPAPAQERRSPPAKRLDAHMLQILEAAWRKAPRNDGWLLLAALGDQLKQIAPDFKPSTYGYKNLGSLIKGLPEHFELRQRGGSVQDVRYIGGHSRPGSGPTR